MSSKIIAALITLLINITIGVIIFFFLLLAMNGYSESDSMYGLGIYIVLALFVSLLMAVCAARAVDLLMTRRFTGVSAAFIAVPIFCVLGAILKIACSVIGVAVAEYVRVHH